MKTRIGFVISLFGAALLCSVVFLLISEATIVPMVSRGTGPGGVEVTGVGWLALITSLFGTGGFALAGIVTALANRIGTHVPGVPDDAIVCDVVELTRSFAALMNDKTNRAAQRRFVFAMVDSAKLISGCETSHENGVILIKYSGYADPVGSR